jgi:hypothetical protein
MPEVHLPQLEEAEEEERGAPVLPTTPRRPRARSVFKVALEVLLISLGVFLGLAGEQWREVARHREVAEASLRRFRSEILTNRKAVAAVKDYHVTTLKGVEAYLAADARTRTTVENPFLGLQPASFEQTAWDLALATQSLAYIDPELAFALARIYNRQQAYLDLTLGVVHAMYLRPPSENLEAFLRTSWLYYADIVRLEPELLGAYDELLPRIDRALGESPTETK